jgi:hypothetical protein
MVQYVAAAAAVTSAVMQYRAAQATEQQYKAKANMEILKGRVAAVQAKEEGVAVLNSTIEQMAYNRAFGGKGNTDVFGGSRLGVGTKMAAKGIEEYNITDVNSRIAYNMGQYQAAIDRSAGKTAKKLGYANAFATLGQGVYTYSKLGGTFPTFG